MTPVILDTDIGTDIDDTWALAMLLRSPELDLKAVVTSHGDTRYRALLVAKLLGIADRADVPVGEGIGDGQLAPGHRRQVAWLDGYGPDDYAGPVRTDGARLMVETIMASPTPVTVLAIGPASTVAAALALAPEIAANARFVGMHGAVRRGYRDSATPVPEYNVFSDVTAFRSVLATPWPITLTPLDTCGVVLLDGEDYARVRDAEDPLMRAVMANYRIWAQASAARVGSPCGSWFLTGGSPAQEYDLGVEDTAPDPIETDHETARRAQDLPHRACGSVGVDCLGGLPMVRCRDPAA